MRRPVWIMAACAALTAGSALALEDVFPSTAQRVALELREQASQQVPITGYVNGQMQWIRAEGAVRQEAWQLGGGSQSTLQILAPLRDHLMADGFDVIFECATSDCGGFDFRYALDVLPEPEMHVDLGDFRFLAAQRAGAERPDYVMLLVSRSAAHGFVQVTRIGPPEEIDAPGDRVVAATKSPDPTALGAPRPAQAEEAQEASLTDRLEAHGRAVLEDLRFKRGSADLEEATFDSLVRLASYLKSAPDQTVVLVGHTDAEGALDINMALSQRRANAVREHLVERLDVSPAQVRAEGVGYLVPLSTNRTEAGRTANRRVEVILNTVE